METKKPRNLKEIENMERLKVRFLEYYKDLPVNKLAGEYVGRSSDTISEWRRKDPVFAEQMDILRAEWAQKNSKGVKSKEWLLERVMKDHFAARSELTGKDGKDLPTPIYSGLATKS